VWKHKVGWRARLFSHTTPFFFLQERNYHVTVGLCLKTQHASRSDFVVTSLPLFSQSATQEENQWEQTKGFVPLGLEIMDLQWDETQKITFWDTTLLDCYKLKALSLWAWKLWIYSEMKPKKSHFGILHFSTAINHILGYYTSRLL